MTTEEKKAQQLIRQHLSKDAPSYKELIQYARTACDDPLVGYTHYYLDHSKDERTMSSSADPKVTMELALIDQVSKENDCFLTLAFIKSCI